MENANQPIEKSPVNLNDLNITELTEIIKIISEDADK